MGASGEMVTKHECTHGSTRSGQRGYARREHKLDAWACVGMKQVAQVSPISGIGDEIGILSAVGASGEMVHKQESKHENTRSGTRGYGSKGAEIICINLCVNKTSSPRCDVSD